MHDLPQSHNVTLAPEVPQVTQDKLLVVLGAVLQCVCSDGGQEVTCSYCTGSGQYVPAAGLSLTPLQGTPQKPSEQAGILQV